MFKVSVFLCCLCLCALTPYIALAMTPEQRAMIHSHFETIGKTCIKDNVISEQDINDLRAKKVPSGPNAPCFLSCMMKQIGVMDDSGILQKETALEMAKSVFQDPEEIKIIEDYLHSCAHVNTASVSDGEKGCDRAMLAFKCMVENASQFGFDI
ncbi:general odorant-binding protein 19d-like [Anticarsia gemmatalis]|uniref:general odorant-binding protein 19d-like n=1 Tax=Anticarsia gemmatalis TaxID=129554 RepID=UPI003F76A559